MNLKKALLATRRVLLRHLVPELYWPKFAEIDGVKVRVRGAPYSFGVKRLLLAGGYEAEERRLLAELLEPGMQVLEMGSSIGIVSSVIAHRIGAGGKLVAIEASADLVAYSRTWLEESPQTKVVAGFGFPVWQVRDSLSVSGFDDKNGSLGGMVAVSDGGEPGEREQIWDMSRACETYGLQPDVLVCDIEGSEAVLLDHDPVWPATLRHVVIELHPSLLAGGDADVQSICRRIEAQGFEQREEIRNTFWFSRRL
ncbi:MAG: hypothetical protein AAGH68_03600 [Pseudomonadota bacterium]